VQAITRSRHVFGAAAGAILGGAILFFVFRGGRSGVSVMTGLVIAGALVGLGLGTMVGLWRLKQPGPTGELSTGDWRDAFRRR
jgi:hypothetical protein